MFDMIQINQQSYLTYTMLKITLAIICLLIVANGHKDQQASIYQPFQTSGQPSDTANEQSQLKYNQAGKHPHKSDKQVRNDRPQNKSGKNKAEQQKIDVNSQASEQRSEQYKEFNELFTIGMFVGTILLVLTLINTCISSGPTRTRFSAQTNNTKMSVARQLEAVNSEIKLYENKISRLKKVSNQLHNKIRRQEQIRTRQLQMQWHMEQQRRCFSTEQYYPYGEGSVHQQGNRMNQIPIMQHGSMRQSIPIGRPLVSECDNNSSFASEYPVL